MNSTSYFRKLFVGYALVAVAATTALALILSRSLNERVHAEAFDELRRSAVAITQLSLPALISGPNESFQSSIRETGYRLSTRITVLKEDGTILADSDAEPEKMDNHALRPEVKAAREGQTGTATRTSRTLNQAMVYVAVKVSDHGETLGYVRSAIPLTTMDQRVAKARSHVVLAAGAATLLGLLLAGGVAYRASKPVSALTESVEAISEGRLEDAQNPTNAIELSGVRHAIFRLAKRLSEQGSSRARRQRRLVTVLSSMVEGVIVIDRNERVLQFNEASRQILGAEETFEGWIWEFTKNRQLIEATRSAVRNGEDANAEITVQNHENGHVRHVKLHASPIRETNGLLNGAVLVLHDVTNERHLETVRRDFVTNLSHELKTPVAAIRALSETILDDADMPPEIRNKFLGKTITQCQRLANLLSDLLSLSRSESVPSRELYPVDVGSVAEQVVESLDSIAQSNSVRLKLETPEIRSKALGDVESIHQIVDHLIDNAIKYSGKGCEVRISVGHDEEQVTLEVADNGIGIPESEQPRVFERFYRVDKARTTAIDGTGLGLAIVRHLVLGMGGRVSLSSRPGQGTTFYVSLPRSPSAP